MLAPSWFCRVVPQTSNTSTPSSPTCLFPPPCAMTAWLWPAASRKQQEHSQAFLTGHQQTMHLCECQYLCPSRRRTRKKQVKSSGSSRILTEGPHRSSLSGGWYKAWKEELANKTDMNTRADLDGCCAWLVYRWGLSCCNTACPTLLPQPPKTKYTCAKYGCTLGL